MITRRVVRTALRVLLCLSAVWPLRGGVIYSDDFSGPASPVTLHAMAPDVRPADQQWAGPANIFANGTCTTGNTSAWLPVTLANDRVYSVVMGIDVLYLANNTTEAGIAFTTATPAFNTATMANAANVGVLKIRRGGSWVFSGVGNDGGLSSGANNSLFTASRMDYAIKLVLTTSSTASWTLDAYLGGVRQDLAPADAESMSYVFPAAPAITGVGLSVGSGTYLLKGFQLEGPVVEEVPATSSRIVDVFFLAGQSNASGRVSTGFSPDARDGQVLYYYQTDGPAPNDVTSGGQFVALQPLASGYYGPEITLGRELVSRGYRPAIIKVSDGGTNLAVNWNSTTYGTLWKNWLSSTDDAFRRLRAMGCVPRLRGFLWLQGETDATNATNAANYEANFTALVGNVNARLAAGGQDVSGMRFVTALIREASGANGAVVRSAQQSVMGALEDGVWFDTDDLNTLSDNLHYDAPAIATIGERFAAPFPAQAGYAEWAAARALTGEEALPQTDPDGNGLANLAEYALGADPVAGGAISPPVAVVTDGGLALSFPVLRGDVVCQPEWSADLVVWNTQGFSVVRTATSSTASMPLAGRDRLFMRLRFGGN